MSPGNFLLVVSESLVDISETPNVIGAMLCRRSDNLIQFPVDLPEQLKNFRLGSH
jgi:hypothetical protein